jgi:hypothetical protein
MSSYSHACEGASHVRGSQDIYEGTAVFRVYPTADDLLAWTTDTHAYVQMSDLLDDDVV